MIFVFGGGDDILVVDVCVLKVRFLVVDYVEEVGLMYDWLFFMFFELCKV